MTLFCQAVLVSTFLSAVSGQAFGQSYNVVQQQGAVSPIAGSGGTSYSGDGGVAVFAGLNAPTSVAIDGQGNLYIADTGNHVIRKVDAETGIISTVAGTGEGGFSGEDGLAKEVQLDGPEHVGIAENGDLYISDTGNRRLRKVSAETGIMSTVYGTPELIPGDIAIDDLNGLVYFTNRREINDRSLESVLRVLPSGDVVPFIEFPSFSAIYHDNIAVDLLGNLFVRYYEPGALRRTIARIDRNSGAEDSIFVDMRIGYGNLPAFFSAFTVTSDSEIYFTKLNSFPDGWNVYRYGAIDLGSGFQEFGEEELSGETYEEVYDLAVDLAGNILFADAVNNKIIRITHRSSFAPDIEVPSTLEFGEIVVGSGKTQSLELVNKGTMGLRILRLSSSASGVSVLRTSGDIESGASAVFEVTIEPLTSGPITGTVEVLSTDPDESSISIAIVGTAFAAEISFDLESGPQDQSLQVLNGVTSGDTVSVQLFGADMPTLTGYSIALQYDPALLDTNTISFDPGPLMPNALAVVRSSKNSMTIDVAATGSSLSEMKEGLMGTLSFIISEGFEQPDSIGINLTHVTFSLGDGALLEVVRRASITLSAEVALVGDFDGDGSVGFSDFLLFAQAFGKSSSDEGYDSRLDLDSDGVVGFSDFLKFASNFGTSA